MLLLVIFLLLLLISGVFLIFTANNFWSFVFAIAFVYIFYLLGKFKSLKGKLLSAGLRQLEQK